MSIIVKDNNKQNKQKINYFDSIEKILKERGDELLISSLDDFIKYHGLDYWYNISIPLHKNICEYLYSFHTLTFNKKLSLIDINNISKEEIDRISELGLLIALNRDYTKLGDARNKILADFIKISRKIDIQIYKKACVTNKNAIVQIYLDLYGKQKVFIDDTRDILNDVKLMNNIQILKLLQKYY